MRNNNNFSFRLWILLLMILIIAFLMLYFQNQRHSIDLYVKKNQVSQQMNIQKLESKVNTLEEIVVLQSQIIMQPDKMEPLPEKSQEVTEHKKTSSSVESDPSLWPATVVGTLQVLKSLINPVKVLLPY